MLKIRLQRKGKIKMAFFDIVVLEHTQKAKGKYLELLGSYDPHAKTLKADKEKILSWISKGAKTTPTVHNLLIHYKITEGEKLRVWKPKKKEGTEEQKTTTPPETKEQEKKEPQEPSEEKMKEPEVAQATS